MEDKKKEIKPYDFFEDVRKRGRGNDDWDYDDDDDQSQDLNNRNQ